MLAHALRFSISILLVSWVSSQPSPKVAIIGCGISGSFLSHFLAAENFTTTTFCPPGCGRVKSTTIQFADRSLTVELGASIAYVGNQLIASTPTSLHKKVPYEDNPSSTFGVYSVASSSFKFRQSNPTPLTFLNKIYNKLLLLWTYPSLLKLVPHVNQAASALDSLYASLSLGATYPTPHSLWSSLSLSPHLTTSWSTFYSTKISPLPSRLYSELSAAVNRVNYNALTPEDDLPALVSLVSHVPLVSGDLFNYVEGNDNICNDVARGEKVNGAISLALYDGGSGKFSLYGGGEMKGLEGGYDVVVLAMPWMQREGGLEFKETSHIDRAVVMDMRFEHEGAFLGGGGGGEYKTTVTTYVEAEGRVKGLRKEGEGEVPESVFFVDGSYSDDEVFSITLIMEEGGRALYKVFSSKNISHTTLEGMFGANAKVLTSHAWSPSTFNGAYPTFSTEGTDDAPFKLDGRGVWSTGVFESTGSAMEIMAISGRVVANGIVKEFREAGARDGGGEGEEGGERYGNREEL
ncbi:hypothetical protein TrCOL_g6322 [Triparma columacea]|uniref:Prenylcysteine lyase domain-containing protein n=1 Tax=Triparma columacea TaxID=722753 RepID=A0A9W7LFH2_9STRA|nr:hypothetical protein TrCOL_g6322 [Triparma columacea]